MNHCVEVNNLTFCYEGNNKTLDNISFSIESGQYISILGHNGSGKSTIAKLLIGLLEKNEGEIIINDTPLSIETLYDIRSQIGIVFQNPDNQFIGSTVRDDIAFGLENMCIESNKMDEIIKEFAAAVNMLDFLDREPTKLSGGQKQRVAIAGILAMSPSIIILDEATSMLDPIGKREINELVRKINKEKQITIISITHDIEEARLSDQIIILNKGKIEAQGTPNQVLTNTNELHKLSLDIPFALKVASGLQSKGYPISNTIDTNQLMEELCQLHLNK